MSERETRPVRIFLVEDEAIILESYRAILEKEGYEVVGSAYTGRQALERIPNTPIDMILMDINLPDMDGFCVLEKLNQETNIPCLFLTGYFSDELVNKATQLGGLRICH